MRHERVDFGEYLLYNRFFERNKSTHRDWESFSKMEPFRIPRIIVIDSNNTQDPDEWKLELPSMPYPWSGYPFLYTWYPEHSIQPVQAGCTWIAYGDSNVAFWTGRSVQQNLPVTTLWHWKTEGNELAKRISFFESSDDEYSSTTSSEHDSQEQDQTEDNQPDTNSQVNTNVSDQQSDPLDNVRSCSGVDQMSDSTRNVRPRVQYSDTPNTSSSDYTRAQTYMICENVYTNVELWDMGAQLCLSNNYENFSNDYKVLEHGNMVAANGAEEKILGVGTKTFSDGLDIKGTIHVPDASASLLAVGHVLAMKEGSYIKIDKKGLCYLLFSLT
jgi:hypothetical protein